MCENFQRENAMKPSRRNFLHLAAGALALPAILPIAWAQAYPSRPVRIIVGHPAGGSFDITARVIAQWLSDRLGRQFLVENRPGAGTSIASETVGNAAPDGHTLLLVGASNAIGATLYEKPNFSFIRDIAPVAGVNREPLIMEVNPSVQAYTVPEFITYARANPGKIHMASGGMGTANHMAGELFQMMTGVKLIHVPYRGGAPAVTDLVGGQVQVLFGSVATSMELVRAGRLRALAVTTAMRSEALPHLPTVGDFMPGYEASNWLGIGAPRHTPAEIILRLNTEINAALADPKVKTRLAEIGSTVLPLSPTEFGKLISDEAGKWNKVIRAANIKPE
jgi:tripartite-type tricarboxylate transporter receptor subunit TctC